MQLVFFLVFAQIFYYAYRWVISYFSEKVDIKRRFGCDWVLITGASSGVGKHLTFLLAKQKINIIGVGRSGQKLNEVKNEVEKLGCQFRPICGDLCNIETVDHIMNEISDLDVGVYVLNAGYPVIGQLSGINDEVINSYVNCMGISLQLICKKIYQRNKDRKYPSAIYCTSSIAADYVFPLCSLYGSLKSLMSSFVVRFSKEIENSCISITALHPGLITESGFFSSLPPFLRWVSSLSLLFQNSESVAEIIVSTLGSDTLIDCGFTTILVRVFSWLFGKFNDYVILICYRLADVYFK